MAQSEGMSHQVRAAGIDDLEACLEIAAQATEPCC